MPGTLARDNFPETAPYDIMGVVFLSWLTGENTGDGSQTRKMPRFWGTRKDKYRIIMDTPRIERAILVGISPAGADHNQAQYQWLEFSELARTAGAEVVGSITQERKSPDPAFFIGSGKVQWLAEEARRLEADLIITLQELSPSQVRNMEEQTGVRVIDRTNLILDIFASRARTREGKLQVELAQLDYLLPRLGGSTRHLSRLGGGIGTRGPGESKLEADRRRVRRRIAELRRQLLEVQNQRKVQRHRREKQQIPTVALIGYTNAGKSTLFNLLTAADVSAADRLFETLDPVSRRVRPPSGKEFILMDTVGFISNLPHQLVAAFKATLEETTRATLLLHVMDGTAPNLAVQAEAVRTVLDEIGIATKERLNLLNKIDLIDTDPTIERMAKEWEALPISARTGAGMEELLAVISGKLADTTAIYRVKIPFGEAGLVDRIHRQGRVLEEVFTPEGVCLRVETEPALADKYHQYFFREGS